METSRFCLVLSPFLPPSHTPPDSFALCTLKVYVPARHSWHFVFRSLLLPTLTVCVLCLSSVVHSERFFVRLNKSGLPKSPEKTERQCTLFVVSVDFCISHKKSKQVRADDELGPRHVTWRAELLYPQDLGSSDLRKDVYIVVHIIRIGMVKKIRLHICENLLNLFKSLSFFFYCTCCLGRMAAGEKKNQCSVQYRRPFGCAVVSIADLLTADSKDDHLLKVYA